MLNLFRHPTGQVASIAYIAREMLKQVQHDTFKI
jgi:hypothetical protein